MAVETELKYRINILPDKLNNPINISQYYLKRNKEVVYILSNIFDDLNFQSIHTIRVRKIISNNVKYVATLKTKSVLYSRKEYEKEISELVFNDLIKEDNIESFVLKNRFIDEVQIDKKNENKVLKFEFDEYLNLKTEFFTCEIEVDEVNDAIKEKIEKVFTKYYDIYIYSDVSLDSDYKNSNLAKVFGYKVDKYKELITNVDSLNNDVNFDISVLANTASLLYHNIDNINWLGFYLYKNDELLLGPFMGEPACTVLKRGRGVCFRSVELGKTLVVGNVLMFDGHIACDARSKSEIVIPIYNGNDIYGVLDIDSPSFYRFSDNDKVNLEKIVKVIEGHLFK